MVNLEGRPLDGPIIMECGVISSTKYPGRQRPRGWVTNSHVQDLPRREMKPGDSVRREKKDPRHSFDEDNNINKTTQRRIHRLDVWVVKSSSHKRICD